MKNNQHKPRFREIVEGAAGNVIGAILLAILGVATGGFTIGWFPTFLVSGALIGGFSLWYKFDPSLQGLIRQRFFKIKHAISSQSIVMARWNLITEETIGYIVRRNNLTRNLVSVEQSRISKINNQEHLELVLNYPNGIKYLSLTDNNGAIIDTYGGFKSLSGECKKCNAIILVKYVEQPGGKSVAEPTTICRRCKHQMNLSVVDFGRQVAFNVKIKSIDKHDIEIKDGKVYLHIEFTMQNFGQTTQVCPRLEIKVAVKEGVNHIEKTVQKDLLPIEIQGLSEKVKSVDVTFSITTVILTRKDEWLLIRLRQC